MKKSFLNLSITALLSCMVISLLVFPFKIIPSFIEAEVLFKYLKEVNWASIDDIAVSTKNLGSALHALFVSFAWTTGWFYSFASSGIVVLILQSFRKPENEPINLKSIPGGSLYQ